MNSWGKSISGPGKNKYKGPKIRVYLARSRNSRGPLSEMGWTRVGRVVEDEVETYRRWDNIELVGHSKYIMFYSEDGKAERAKQTFTGKGTDCFIEQNYEGTRVELESWWRERVVKDCVKIFTWDTRKESWHYQDRKACGGGTETFSWAVWDMLNWIHVKIQGRSLHLQIFSLSERLGLEIWS